MKIFGIKIQLASRKKQEDALLLEKNKLYYLNVHRNTFQTLRDLGHLVATSLPFETEEQAAFCFKVFNAFPHALNSNVIPNHSFIASETLQKELLKCPLTNVKLTLEVFELAKSGCYVSAMKIANAIFLKNQPLFEKQLFLSK